MVKNSQLKHLIREVIEEMANNKVIPFDPEHGNWQVGIRHIPAPLYAWFRDKEPLMISMNKLEAQQRLYWLSEGSLHYHLKGKAYTTRSDGRPSRKRIVSSI